MKAALFPLLAVIAGSATAAGHVVDIAWSVEGQFTHKATLAPKEFLEVCGKLPRGGRVQWSYDATAPLPFNIHVHQGKDIVYPARLEQAESAQGLQVFDAEPAHCWMWTNKSAETVRVSVQLQQPR